MADYEIFRNGSGYVDITAYRAIKNYQEGEKNMGFNRGDVFEYKMGTGEWRSALIVSADYRTDESYASIIVLSPDQKKEGHYVPVVCQGLMYADCSMVSFGRKSSFGDYLRTATDKEMKQIDAGIIKCLGLEVEMPDVKDSPVSPEAVVQVLPVDVSEELTKAKAEADIYKELYEKLLAKMVG